MKSSSSPPSAPSSSSSAPVSVEETPQSLKTDPPTPHYLPTPALDHAFSGIVAGAVATVCMNPLDLIKVQFQVDTSASNRRYSPSSRLARLGRLATGGDVARDMASALRAIVRRDGWTGLYRGLSPNVVGNSASWGLYFLWYTMIKEHMTDAEGGRKLSPGQHLLAASESGAITALMTNPIWVVKTRMFTTSRSGQAIAMANVQAQAKTSTSASVVAAPQGQAAASYRGLYDGLRQIWRYEGIRGMYKGAGLALFGVSNGAIQFVCYEELKRWRMAVARRKAWERGERIETTADEAVKLDNSEYIVISGVAKLAAIGITYPYQVIRSRIQNHATMHLYPNIPTCIRLTWKNEGIRGFYKGMSANLVRIIPGTCVTFVVYENTSWFLRRLAQRRGGPIRSDSTSL